MLAANIGVIGGIFFLAIEVNQNQESIELQNSINLVDSRGASVDFFNNFRLLRLERQEVNSAWVKGRNGEPLNSEETANFSIICEYMIWGQFNLYVRMSSLELNQEADGQLNLLGRTLRDSSDYAECWNRQKDLMIERGYGDFVRQVDEIIHKL